MSEEIADLIGRIDRRGFLGTGAAALAAATILGDGEPAAAEGTHKKTKKPAKAVEPPNKTTDVVELPKRKLGRTGVDVTMLSLGTWMSPGGERLLRSAWANGIRYVDTAKSYGSEPMIARWLQAMPVPRKELFLVTKDQPNTPQTAHRATGRAAGGTPDRLRRLDLPPRPGRPQLRPRDAMGHESGIQAGCRRDPRFRQGEVRWVLDPSSRTTLAAPGRRARRVCGRHHASEQSLDRTRGRHESRSRCLL